MSRELRRAALLFLLTLASVLWAGAEWKDVDIAREGPLALLQGYDFALPLMGILLAHELAHYWAARRHGIAATLPYFIPLPFTLLGTFGAVVELREPVRRRDALFDIGAAGPLAGLVVALPLLTYGVATSPVEPLDPELHSFVLGESLLHAGLLYWLKGPIPVNHDVVLNATALAGWAGLLLTMLSLVPTGKLDGGQMACAVFGAKQERYSRHVRAALLALACAVAALSAYDAWRDGARGDALWGAAAGGLHWLAWWFVVSVMARFEAETEPLEPGTLSRGRRFIACFVVLLFGLLFMPTWLKQAP